MDSRFDPFSVVTPLGEGDSCSSEDDDDESCGKTTMAGKVQKGGDDPLALMMLAPIGESFAPGVVSL